MEYPLTELMEFDEILDEYMNFRIYQRIQTLTDEQANRLQDLANEMRVRIPRRGMQ